VSDVQRRRDGAFLCHKGALVAHMVACCDGMPVGLLQKAQSKEALQELK
jgi:precorrin isomerase